MLVLANGAFKSGSSWLLAIVKHMAAFEEVPDEFRSPFHKQAWIDAPKLASFLASDRYRITDIVSKGHFYGAKARNLLADRPDVYVLDIQRDLKDSLVSHYYHVKRERKLSWEFDEYYRRLGRYKAVQILAYHETWHEPASNLYMSSYERLKSDFEAEVACIATFLGLELSPSDIANVKVQTSLATMQKVRGQDKIPEADRFFRKGAVGDWETHFDDASLADLARIESQGIGPIGLAVYSVMFDIRPRLTNAFRRAARPVLGTKPR